MIDSADMGVGKVAGIKLDPTTGELKTAFVIDNMSTTFQPLYGPMNKRVLALTNMRKNVALEPNDLTVFFGNYTEQFTCNDAATDRQRFHCDAGPAGKGVTETAIDRIQIP